MSRGKKLQEMEVKTQQSRTAVNANAKLVILCLKWQIPELSWQVSKISAVLPQKTTSPMMIQQSFEGTRRNP